MVHQHATFVHAHVAVVVHAYRGGAVVRDTRVASCRSVIAVAAHRGGPDRLLAARHARARAVAVAIGVRVERARREGLVGAAVAVVVHVGQRGAVVEGRRVHLRALVVAVAAAARGARVGLAGHERRAHAVAVSVEVCVEREAGAALVGRPVAVVVHHGLRAASVDGARMRGRVVVVAVAAAQRAPVRNLALRDERAHVAVAVPVHVGIPVHRAGRFVHRPVTVVVAAVAHLHRGSRGGVGVAVVAVRVSQLAALVRDAVEVVVLGVTHTEREVGASVAIIVDAVAALAGGGVHVVRHVVAVADPNGPASQGRAAVLRQRVGRGDAPAVSVGVHVPGHRQGVLVGHAVAVVVGAVADLRRRGPRGRRRVVAVTCCGGQTWRTRAAQALRAQRAHTVVVGVHVELHQQALVRATVAVVVVAVTHLGHEWVHSRARVVAVGPARRAVAAGGVHRAVAVHVAAAQGRGVAVFVQAFEVTHLERAGEHHRVGVVAVVSAARHRVVAVTVSVGRVAVRVADARGLFTAVGGAGGGRRSADAPAARFPATHAALGPVAEDAVVAVPVSGALAGPRVLHAVGAAAARWERDHEQSQPAHPAHVHRCRSLHRSATSTPPLHTWPRGPPFAGSSTLSRNVRSRGAPVSPASSVRQKHPKGVRRDVHRDDVQPPVAVHVHHRV